MPIKRSLADNQFQNVGMGIAPTSAAFITLPSGTTVATGGILWGTDTNLYRLTTDSLKTDDNLTVGTNIAVGTTINSTIRANVLQTVTDPVAAQYGVSANISSTQTGANAQGLYGMQANITIAGSGGNTGIITASNSLTTYNNTGTGTNINSASFNATQGALSGGVNTMRGIYTRNDNNHATTPIVASIGINVASNIGAGPITNQTGVLVAALVGTGTNYGIQVMAPTGGTTNYAINLGSAGLSGGILFTTDTNLYRSTTTTLKTDGNFIVGTNLTVTGTTTFTGVPTLPTGTIAVTQAAADSTTAVATTAFVTTANNLKANLASPTFTGTPTLPTGAVATTQAAADSTTKLATTAFVTTADNLKANLASPALTGTPTVNGEPIAGRAFSMAMC